MSLFALCISSGCDAGNYAKTSWYRFFDPSAIVKRPSRTLMNPIFTSASTADEYQEFPPGAAGPTPEDLTYTTEEYKLGPGDVADIGVLDLFQEGVETVLRRTVSASGFIDLPLLPERLRAEGLSKDELQDAIIRAYSPDILRSPMVSVNVIVQQQNTFSVLGAVQVPGTYPIYKKGMRLLDALAAARGISITNIKYIYVIRPAATVVRDAAPTATQPIDEQELELPPLPEIPADPEPAGPTGEPAAEGLPTEAEPAETTVPDVPDVPVEADSPATTTTTDEQSEIRELIPGTKPEVEGVSPALAQDDADTVPATDAATTTADADATTTDADATTSDVDATTTDAMADATTDVATDVATDVTTDTRGSDELRDLATRRSTKWVEHGSGGTAVEQDVTTAKVTPSELPPTTATTTAADPFGWKKKGGEAGRVIAINVQKLRDGDETMNIVIQNNDIVNVPLLERAAFYVYGEVARPGVYDLTGMRLTIKQALSAAGGVGPLAWPSNSVLTRRIGDSQEQTIPINIERIFKGEEPDMFLKADDVIAVGTHVVAPFYAVFRNAFRMTYGYGFIYDRNFADPVPAGVNSRRFTRL